ncbi:hypothetical protein phiFa_15 [Thermus phage phiFa]|nr:hypothetical protein phiFa_15 [Thermus phage phiFa]
MPYDLSVVEGFIDLTAWAVKEGAEEFKDFVLYDENAYMRGELPSIFSYWGHPIPSRFTEVHYIGRGKRHLRAFVCLKSREFDHELGVVFEKVVLTVPAWQGDNNLIHLLEVLPGETLTKLNFYRVLEQGKHLPDVLTRLYRYYDHDTLMELEPGVFYFYDPVGQSKTSQIQEHELRWLKKFR